MDPSPATPKRPARPAGAPHGNPWHGTAGKPLHAPAWDAPMDHAPPRKGRPPDSAAISQRTPVAPARQRIAANVDEQKMPAENKGPGAVVRPVGHADAAPVCAIPGPANGRRQRRPTQIVAMGDPNHPGRGPNPAGQPDPAVIGIPIPTAIVKRRPAPFVSRCPIPAIFLGPDPSSAGIGPPVRVHIRGTPDPAIILMLKLLAVGRQTLFKVFRCDHLGICRRYDRPCITSKNHRNPDKNH